MHKAVEDEPTVAKIDQRALVHPICDPQLTSVCPVAGSGDVARPSVVTVRVASGLNVLVHLRLVNRKSSGIWVRTRLHNSRTVAACSCVTLAILGCPFGPHVNREGSKVNQSPELLARVGR